MKGYESIPSTAKQEGSAFQSSNDDDNHCRRPALVKWSVGLITLILFVVLSSTMVDNESSNKTFGSLRSASIILPTSHAENRNYNHNEHVKLLAYDQQKVNHFRDDNDKAYHTSPPYWSQRYYQSTQYWKGPGFPILVIIGGESVENFGFIYPFVADHLAPYFGAAVVQPEHRFYGPVKPVENATKLQLLELLTVPQALADLVDFVQHARQQLGCNPDRASPQYCPVVTIGGSYPGFLSALGRIVYPQFIDIAYSASAPLLLYGQLADPNVYYDVLTEAYERSSPGCAAAVKRTLMDMVATVERVANETSSLPLAAEAIGVCPELPAYMNTSDLLWHAIVETASGAFHDANLFSYPPGKDSDMYKVCQIFQTHEEPLMDFFNTYFLQLPPDKERPPCFDMVAILPKDGITVDDSPDEPNHNGIVWDFQVCTDLVFILGYSDKSMLPPKNASYEALTEHCRQRFGVTPRPWQLVDKWDFGNLEDHSNILFTNGMQDVWSAGGITWNVSDTVLSLFFPNGAHHSDLTLQGPNDRDTDDIKYGHIQIKNILGTWIDQIRNPSIN